jgi:hypothetical protein
VASTFSASHLERMIDAHTLSRQLGGKVTHHALVRWARQGRLPGAILLANRWLFDARSASWILSNAGAVVEGPPEIKLTPAREPFRPSNGIPWTPETDAQIDRAS